MVGAQSLLFNEWMNKWTLPRYMVLDVTGGACNPTPKKELTSDSPGSVFPT